MIGMRVQVRSVTVLGGFEVRLGFTDGSECTVDLAPYLGGPGSQALPRDAASFAGVRVDAAGRLSWPSGEEIAPEVLHEGSRPASAGLRASGRR
jgi:hypothetical protein